MRGQAYIAIPNGGSIEVTGTIAHISTGRALVDTEVYADSRNRDSPKFPIGKIGTVRHRGKTNGPSGCGARGAGTRGPRSYSAVNRREPVDNGNTAIDGILVNASGANNRHTIHIAVRTFQIDELFSTVRDIGLRGAEAWGGISGILAVVRCTIRRLKF